MKFESKLVQKRGPIRAPFYFWSFFLILILVGSVGFFIYYPGLNSPFILDDFPNFSDLNYVSSKMELTDILLYLSMDTSAAIGRTVSIASFLLNKSDWPLNPFGFKIINLFIHVFTFWLVAAFLHRLLVLLDFKISNKTKILSACAFSAIWLLSPMQTTTVYYAVQRIAQLAAMFSMLALHRTATTLYARLVAVVFLAVFMLCGFLSKENASLIFLIFALVEIYIFQWQGGKGTRITLFLFVIVPAVAILGWMIFNPIVHPPDYSRRDFTMAQRLMTQVYCVFDYFKQFVLPNVTRISVFHDDLKPVRSIADGRFIAGSAFLVLVLFCIFLFRSRNKLVSFGLAWFLVWHSLEASAIPLELYFEHRNYLPSIGICIVLLGVWISVMSAVRSPSMKNILVLGLAGYVAALGFLTFLEAKKWEYPYFMAARWLKIHPDSRRAKEFYMNMARVFDSKKDSTNMYLRYAEKSPHNLVRALSLKYLSCLDGKQYITEKQFRDLKPTSSYDLPAISTIHQLLIMAESNTCKVPLDLNTYTVLLKRYAKEPGMYLQLENIYLMLQRIARLEGRPDLEEKYFAKGYKVSRTPLYSIIYYERLQELGKKKEARELLVNLNERLSHHWIPIKNLFGYLYIKLMLEKGENMSGG